MIKKELKSIVKAIICEIPGSIGIKIRKIYYKRSFRCASDSFYILPKVTIEFPSNFQIGTNSGINSYTWISAMGGVIIGNNVIIGPHVIIHSANHNFDRLDIPIKCQGWNKKCVKIENDVWVGANATILPGVTIGGGSVIGAGAVVTRDIPSYSVAMGIPAKIIKNRKKR